MATKTGRNDYLLHQQLNMLLIQNLMFRQALISSGVTAELTAPK